jgi:predicted DNA-binding transcriptional regulator AlpA
MRRQIRELLARKLDFVMPPSTEMLTRREVCRFLRVSKDTVMAWHKRGIGPPFVKLTRQVVRYPVRSFKRYLREHLNPVIPEITEAPKLRGGEGH